MTVVTAVALWILAALLPGLWIDRPRDALLAGLVVGLVGSIVWPALAFIIVPISVLTLGLGAIVLEALVVALVLDSLPGIHLDGFWTAIFVALGLAAVTTLVSTLLAVDDDSSFDQTTARRAAGEPARPTSPTYPVWCSFNWTGLPIQCSSGRCAPAMHPPCIVGSAMVRTT